MSGIWFFQIPPDALYTERDFKGDFGIDSNVEVIRASHRYAVVYPSWHPGAEATYYWYDRVGMQMERPPDWNELEELPQSWDRHLMHRCECFEKERQALREQMSRYKGRPTGIQGTVLANLDFKTNVENLERMPMGGRNNYLSSVGGRTLLFDVLINNTLDSSGVMKALLDAATEAGLEEQEAMATIESAWRWALDIYEGEVE